MARKRLTVEALRAIEARMNGCPFCGSADVHAVDSPGRGLSFECDECMADVTFDPLDARTASESVARWNRRDYFKSLDEIAENEIEGSK